MVPLQTLADSLMHPQNVNPDVLVDCVKYVEELVIGQVGLMCTTCGHVCDQHLCPHLHRRHLLQHLLSLDVD
jgi:hypothetical protein